MDTTWDSYRPSSRNNFRQVGPRVLTVDDSWNLEQADETPERLVSHTRKQLQRAKKVQQFLLLSSREFVEVVDHSAGFALAAPVILDRRK